MTAVEIFGTLFAIVCIAFTVKQNLWWVPTGLVNNALWMVMFYRARLYADFALQFVYVALTLYAWWEWLHGGERKSELHVSRTSRRTAIVLAALVALSVPSLGHALDRFTDTDVPYWDALPTVLYLTAQWMLARKLLENWIVWIAGNALCIVLYAYKHLYLTSAVQLVFIALSVQGYVEWKRDLAARASGAREQAAAGGA